MCGIVGFVTLDTAFKIRKADFFLQALYADALRGFHSTGVFTVEKDYSAFYAKDKVDAMRFLDSAGHMKYVKGVDSGVRLAVGHNRHATMGGKGIESAHPFTTKNVTLVHNGTLRGSWRRDLPEHPKADVDSARVCQALNDAKTGGKAVLEKIEGAYTFVWYDHRTKSLYMARNAERPMSYCIVDKTLYFASEGGMLEWLLSPDRANVHENPVASSLPTGAIHRWKLDDPKLNLEKPRVVKYTPYTPPAYTTSTTNSAGWWRSGNHLGAGGAGGRSGDGTVPTKKPEEDEDKERKAALSQRLQDLKLDMKADDTIEVQGGEIMPYKESGVSGQTLGWFDPEDLEGIDDNFEFNLYADVHNIPILTQEEVQDGKWYDSYYARVVGVADNQPEWMSAGDVLLTTVFEEVAARTDPKPGGWAHDLERVFQKSRHRYQVNDRPQHECGTEFLTNRELDMITDKLKCTGCNIGASMVARSDISLNQDGTEFECLECAIKALEEKEKKAS